MPRLPSGGRLVARTLEEAASPAFALDSQRQIVFANQALAAWLGVDAAQLVGRRCNYDAAGGDDSLAAICAGLCPPPDAFSGKVTQAQLSRVAADQQHESRSARFLHLS